MPKIMYTKDGETITAEDEQVEFLLKDGFTFHKAKKKKEEKVESSKEKVAKISSEDTDKTEEKVDTKKKVKVIKKKK